MNQLDKAISEEESVEFHAVMDNASSHKTDAVKRWIARRPRYHVQFTPTPTGASWLNQVERFFQLLLCCSFWFLLLDVPLSRPPGWRPKSKL